DRLDGFIPVRDGEFLGVLAGIDAVTMHFLRAEDGHAQPVSAESYFQPLKLFRPVLTIDHVALDLVGSLDLAEVGVLLVAAHPFPRGQTEQDARHREARQDPSHADAPGKLNLLETASGPEDPGS